MTKNPRWGAYLGLILGQLAIAGYKSYKKQRKELLAEYQVMARTELANHAVEQASFEDNLAGLPSFEGDEGFGVKLDLSFADTYALEQFYLYLESTSQKGFPVTAVISRAQGEQVRVEISQAFIATISGELGGQLYFLLKAAPYGATCLTRITKSKGAFAVHLDLASPPQIKK